MKVIYFIVDEDNRLSGGYSSSSSFNENEISLELPEGHDFFNGPSFIYRYIEGELIKDGEFELRSIRKAKFDNLSAACQNDILGYFEATVNSVAFSFSFDAEAQANFTGTLALFTEGLITEMEWTAYLDGKAERIVLDKANFLGVIATAFQAKNAKISRLRNELQPLLEQAATQEEIEAITW